MSEHPKDSPKQDQEHAEDPTRETVVLGDTSEENPTTPPDMVATVRSKETLPQEVAAKYKVLKELGKGGFAWVYLVKNLDLDRLEAIKILNSDLAMEEDVCNRFVKEAQISANFNHQNIVTIYEVQRRGYWSNFDVSNAICTRHNEPFVYFTMSFVEGNTSTNLIRKHTRIPQKQAIRIVMDACNALDYAHGNGVIHRDIKPDNIIVDRRGQGIVMDFGIAKVVDQTRQTAAGTFMGTARYVSPEQALGKEIDGRSDLYSLGITLYELVTGRVPFDAEEWMTVLYAHVHKPPPSPERFYAKIDRDLRTVILKMLEKKPENRFQTAREVHDALSGVYQKLGGPVIHTEAIDKIGTRPDLVARQENTSATHVDKTQIKAPPSRMRSRTAPPSVAVPSQEASSSGFTKWWLGVLALAIAGVLAFFLWPKPGPDVDPVPIPPAQESRLLITAFPKGRIVEIINEDHPGETIDFHAGDLPVTLQLPRGNYQIIVEYEGKTEKENIFISPNIDLARVHVEFEMEDEKFLLEDLR